MGSFEKLRPVSLLLIRLAVGAIFIVYGYEKYQRGFAAASQAMVHLKLPAFFGYIAIALELGGGIFLILGLLFGHLMPDHTASHCTGYRMMPGHMTDDAADHGTLDATFGVCRAVCHA